MRNALLLAIGLGLALQALAHSSSMQILGCLIVLAGLVTQLCLNVMPKIRS
jgi:hypothetical protein